MACQIFEPLPGNDPTDIWDHRKKHVRVRSGFKAFNSPKKVNQTDR